LDYPTGLPVTTLKGYLGETLAGIVAEDYHPFDVAWQVPAFLFRYHDDAFYRLEAASITVEDDVDDDPPDGEELLDEAHASSNAQRNVPGRRGDDCLAFWREPDGTITKLLVCEGKCSAGHRSDLIADGHEKLSSNRLPVSLLQLIDILMDYRDEKSSSWRTSLHQLELQRREGTSTAERHDLLAYVCGRSRASGAPWLPVDRPHQNYLAARPLEVVEIHMAVQQVIDSVYDRA
jgi:hypothetical protein